MKTITLINRFLSFSFFVCIAYTCPSSADYASASGYTVNGITVYSVVEVCDECQLDVDSFTRGYEPFITQAQIDRAKNGSLFKYWLFTANQTSVDATVLFANFDQRDPRKNPLALMPYNFIRGGFEAHIPAHQAEVISFVSHMPPTDYNIRTILALNRTIDPQRVRANADLVGLAQSSGSWLYYFSSVSADVFTQFGPNLAAIPGEEGNLWNLHIQNTIYELKRLPDNLENLDIMPFVQKYIFKDVCFDNGYLKLWEDRNRLCTF